MGKSLNWRTTLLAFGAPLSIMLLMALLTSSPAFKNNPNELSIGITADLLITAPLLYFLLIRKTKIPNTTVLPVLILGVVVASILLPTENQTFLNLFKTWGLPVIELSVLTYIILKVRRAIKLFKIRNDNDADFYTVLKSTCEEMLPKPISTPVAMEVSVLYYGFFNWKKRVPKFNEFTYHKKSSSMSLLIALLLIAVVETIVLHVLLETWSAVAAWMLTALSLYFVLQVIGFIKSLSQRLIAVTENEVLLRYGILAETAISLEVVERVELTSADIEEEQNIRILSPLGQLENHNVILHLKAEQMWYGLYGMRRKYTKLAFHVDDIERFKKLIEKNLSIDSSVSISSEP